MIDAGEYADELTALGFDANEVKQLRALAERKRVDRAREQAISTIRTAYIGHRLGEPEARAALAARGVPAPAVDAVFAVKVNYGVQAVRRLAGNVGLIELNFFPARKFGEPLLDRYAAAMTLVRDTRALIVDVREHMGGDPATVAYVASYFFERPSFVVNRIRYRPERIEEYATTAAPRGGRYGERRPVFVLTSANTFSGGEELAYDLQATRRARIVGEVTGGGANPNEAFDLGGGFVAYVPNGAAINPITRTNWEGAGVAPDVRVDAAKAQASAQRLALEAALAQATDDAERASIREALVAMKG